MSSRETERPTLYSTPRHWDTHLLSRLIWYRRSIHPVVWTPIGRWTREREKGHSTLRRPTEGPTGDPQKGHSTHRRRPTPPALISSPQGDRGWVSPSPKFLSSVHPLCHYMDQHHQCPVIPISPGATFYHVPYTKVINFLPIPKIQVDGRSSGNVSDLKGIVPCSGLITLLSVELCTIRVKTQIPKSSLPIVPVCFIFGNYLHSHKLLLFGSYLQRQIIIIWQLCRDKLSWASLAISSWSLGGRWLLNATDRGTV